jgi:hypothetical protein
LAILEEDSFGSRLLCLEEPENGINPKKIQEMVGLLETMATDTYYAVDDDNPLRQVIINTHSPIVIGHVDAESLYLAKEKELYDEKLQRKIVYTGFSALPGTWKTTRANAETTSLGDILAYLENPESRTSYPVVVGETIEYYQKQHKLHKSKRTVKETIQQLTLSFPND